MSKPGVTAEGMGALVDLLKTIESQLEYAKGKGVESRAAELRSAQYSVEANKREIVKMEAQASTLRALIEGGR